MKAGQALDDADRAPWLSAIAAWIDARQAAGEGGVVTCSALKRAYRDTLRAGRADLCLVFLQGDRAIIAERVQHRRHAYMPASLLGSQFAALEPPAPDEGALAIDAGLPLAEQIDTIVSLLS